MELTYCDAKVVLFTLTAKPWGMKGIKKMKTA
jgi:hypothetical protein